MQQQKRHQALPLRLCAEPVACTFFGRKCFVLSLAGDQLALIIDDDGVAAIASSSRISTDEVARRGGISAGEVPDVLLVREAHDKPVWLYKGKAVQTLPGGGRAVAAMMGISSARSIVESIHAYYELQVREPSVRGFLSILEKQVRVGAQKAPM